MSRTRALLSQLTPPAALQVARRIAPRWFRAPPPPRVRCEGRYATYADAARAAGSDYQAAALVEAVLAKTLAYRARLAAPPLPVSPAIDRMAVTLALVGPLPHLRVLDFGGAFATHYWISRALVPAKARLSWTVVETPAMCARAVALPPPAAGDELRFCAELDDALAAGTPDLVYCDGVLHALPEPRRWLERLLSTGARYVALPRVGTAEQDVHTVLRFSLSDHEPAVPLPPDLVDGPSPIALSLITRGAVEAALARAHVIRARFADERHRFDDVTLTLVGYVGELATSSGH